MQRKFKFLLIVATGLILSCNSFDKLKGQESAILSKEQMVQLLTDIHIAEAKVSELGMSGDTVQVTQSKYLQFVCDKNKTSIKAFDDSYHFYTTQPVLLDSIYQQVIANLSLLESEHKNDFMKSQESTPEQMIETIIK
jgi:hypothetical protein